MALNSQSVESIFSRMLTRYGAAWRAKWAGVNPDAVKSDWANELHGFSDRAIFYALGYLPLDFPPSVGEFAAICRRCPEYAPPALPAPKADPERVAALLAKAMAAQRRRPARQWAYDLQEREKAGVVLTERQRHAWREALRDVPESEVSGWFTPIPADCLPPLMREDRAA